MSGAERDAQIAERTMQDFAWNGQTFQKGEFVAILNGAVVVVSDNAMDAINALREIDPDPRQGMVVEIGHAEVDLIRWEAAQESSQAPSRHVLALARPQHAAG